MTEKDTIVINDDLFLNTVSCPLKFFHITNDYLNRNSSRLYFRQRNKLHIRDAIATRFKNSRRTSNSVEKASQETTMWLKEESVAICGAVVQHENLLTRIPILVKNGRQLTIVQVHGKLRKQSEGDEIRPGIKKSSIVRYLLKAAYRLEVLKQYFPEGEIDVYFYFPNKHFKSSEDNLHLFNQPQFSDSKRIKDQLYELFTKVGATSAVEWVRKRIPAGQSHQLFHNESVLSAIEKIKLFIDQPQQNPGINRHESCKYCDFRLPNEEEMNGCWSQFFTDQGIEHPEKHIYELIGHGNNAESENGSYYQEQAEFSRSFDSLQKMIDQGGPAITILDRRNLQILQAKNHQVPSLWLKKGVKVLDDLKFPLHFLDFEAATYALPMKKESRPYTPVYFQFSCHTLLENGNLIHTEWLDLQEGSEHPHREFVRHLEKIPNIFEGTIMQYSPFEKQGINRLIADFKRDEHSYQYELDFLEKIRTSDSPGYEYRYFDVSRIIRDYYFNEFLKDSLGLKHILKSIIQWEKFTEFTDFFDGQIIKGLDLEEGHNLTIPLNTYHSENVEYSISDGSEAMNSWLAMKNGLLSKDEEQILPEILQKYCTLDSFALFVIFKHIKRFTATMDDEDYIAFQ